MHLSPIEWRKGILSGEYPRIAQREWRRWPVMQFGDALPPLTSNDQERLTESQRSQRDQRASEVEPCSGDAEAQRGGKGVWYSEELDRDIWRS